MKKNIFHTKGFTLIEILVVVLIIGILAAIAVPKYQYAVLKTKYHTIIDMTTAVKEAQEVYYLANGRYAEHFNELDFSLPAGAEIGHFVGANNGTAAVNNLAQYEAMFFNEGNSVIVLMQTQVISILLKDGNRFLDYNLRLNNQNMWGGARALCAAWGTSQGEKLCRDLSQMPGTCGMEGSRYKCFLY